MSQQEILDEAELEKRINQIQADAPKYLTEAYEDFKHRLCMDYLILNMKDQQDGGKFELIKQVLNMVPGNSSASDIDIKTTCATIFCWLLVPYCWLKTRTIFEVEANKFAFVVEPSEKQGERTVIYGPGYHILGYGYRLEGVYSFDQEVDNNIIQSSVGDLKIAKVEQGFIMHLICGGQNVLLGPGIHLINQPMQFQDYISLDSFLILVGPEKWITIPSGYDGISINRGSLNILEGGTQHYLPHVSDKFVKMVPKTIQTDKIPTDIPSYVYNLTQHDERKLRMNQGNNIKKKGKRQQNFHNQDIGEVNNLNEQSGDPALFMRTTTAEGATVILDCMLQWRILDTKLAALTAMEILKVGTIGDEQNDEQAAITASSKNICNLRLTVLRIAKHHLTTLVGNISLTGKSSVSAQIQEDQGQKEEDENYDFNAGSDFNEPLIKKTERDNKPKKKFEAEKTQFDILSSIQKETQNVKEAINQELKKIGCKADTVCIYKVTPSVEIQRELDRQTKAKVDANTEIISALSEKQSSTIEQDILTRNALKQAQSDQRVLIMESQSISDAKTRQAKGEADAIITVAKARREEAEQLQAHKIAKDLAITRVVGEVGAQIFQGTSHNTVYGSNPGAILNDMVQSFSGHNKR